MQGRDLKKDIKGESDITPATTSSTFDITQPLAIGHEILSYVDTAISQLPGGEHLSYVFKMPEFAFAVGEAYCSSTAHSVYDKVAGAAIDATVEAVFDAIAVGILTYTTGSPAAASTIPLVITSLGKRGDEWIKAYDYYLDEAYQANQKSLENLPEHMRFTKVCDFDDPIYDAYPLVLALKGAVSTINFKESVCEAISSYIKEKLLSEESESNLLRSFIIPQQILPFPASKFCSSADDKLITKGVDQSQADLQQEINHTKKFIVGADDDKLITEDVNQSQANLQQEIDHTKEFIIGAEKLYENEQFKEKTAIAYAADIAKIVYFAAQSLQVIQKINLDKDRFNEAKKKILQETHRRMESYNLSLDPIDSYMGQSFASTYKMVMDHCSKNIYSLIDAQGKTIQILSEEIDKLAEDLNKFEQIKTDSKANNDALIHHQRSILHRLQKIKQSTGMFKLQAGLQFASNIAAAFSPEPVSQFVFGTLGCIAGMIGQNEQRRTEKKFNREKSLLDYNTLLMERNLALLSSVNSNKQLLKSQRDQAMQALVFNSGGIPPQQYRENLGKIIADQQGELVITTKEYEELIEKKDNLEKMKEGIIGSIAYLEKQKGKHYKNELENAKQRLQAVNIELGEIEAAIVVKGVIKEELTNQIDTNDTILESENKLAIVKDWLYEEDYARRLASNQLTDKEIDKEIDKKVGEEKDKYTEEEIAQIKEEAKTEAKKTREDRDFVTAIKENYKGILDDKRERVEAITEPVNCFV